MKYYRKNREVTESINEMVLCDIGFNSELCIYKMNLISMGVRAFWVRRMI